MQPGVRCLPNLAVCMDGMRSSIKELTVGLALQFDEQMAQQAEAAALQGNKLCYVGLIDLEAKACRVALEVRVSPLCSALVPSVLTEC